MPIMKSKQCLNHQKYRNKLRILQKIRYKAHKMINISKLIQNNDNLPLYINIFINKHLFIILD